MHKLLLCAVLLCFGSILHATADGASPLDLKFTSVDGKDIDLAKMRGKVVLIDFWATWCPPCVAEVPDVVGNYKRFHDRGFEILGVSLDQDVDAMKTFTAQHEMPWVQYCDGKGWDSKVSSDFGIQSIPTMWLIGKDGKIITTTAGVDLAGQVKKAIETPYKP